MSPDWTNAQSADGPTVVAWVAERCPAVRANRKLHKDDPFVGTVASWDRPGRLVDFYTVDQWLTPRGLFLSELPRECWRWAPAKCRIHLREVAEQAISEYVAGERGRNELARVYQIEHRIVNRWIEGLAA